MLIDFTNCEKNIYKAYGGANGNKINVRYNGASFMLKFPPRAMRNRDMSYSNGCISEYIACHIYESLGFRVQETLLGTYTDGRGKKKLVVACRDFTENGKRLIEFAQLKNTCINSDQNGYGTELSSILEAIDEQKLLPPYELREFFWDMFIADAFLGNFDRHNGNWGVLVDEKAQSAEIAPIYDCGSCLFPQLDLSRMSDVLKSENEIKSRVLEYPTSAIQVNGEKINYHDFIFSCRNSECNAALERISGRIDMDTIRNIIEQTPTLQPIQVAFYERILEERYARIIQESMSFLSQQEQSHSEETQMDGMQMI